MHYYSKDQHILLIKIIIVIYVYLHVYKKNKKCIIASHICSFTTLQFKVMLDIMMINLNKNDRKICTW